MEHGWLRATFVTDQIVDGRGAREMGRQRHRGRVDACWTGRRAPAHGSVPAARGPAQRPARLRAARGSPTAACSRGEAGVAAARRREQKAAAAVHVPRERPNRMLRRAAQWVPVPPHLAAPAVVRVRVVVRATHGAECRACAPRGSFPGAQGHRPAYAHATICLAQGWRRLPRLRLTRAPPGVLARA